MLFQPLVKHFLRGLLVVAPVAATIYIFYVVLTRIDSWINVDLLLDRRVPGAGIVITVTLVTLAGFLASNFATRWLFRIMDRLFVRLPLVKLIYTSLKDLLEAFVGDKKRFDKPVLVSLAGTEVSVMGFLTRKDLRAVGLAGHVAVYFPQSYNFAGNLVLVPAERVRPFPVDSSAAMTFIVSGGISGDLGPVASS